MGDPIADILYTQGPIQANQERAQLETQRIAQEARLKIQQTLAAAEVDRKEQLRTAVADQRQERFDQLQRQREQMAKAAGREAPKEDPVEAAIPESFDINTGGPGPSPGRFAPTSVAEALAAARGGAGAQSAMASGGSQMFPVQRPQAAPGGPAGPVDQPGVTVGGQRFEAPSQVGELVTQRGYDYQRAPSGTFVRTPLFRQTHQLRDNVLTPGDILTVRQRQAEAEQQRIDREREFVAEQARWFLTESEHPELAGQFARAQLAGDGAALEALFKDRPTLSAQVSRARINESIWNGRQAAAAIRASDSQTLLNNARLVQVLEDANYTAARSDWLERAGVPGLRSLGGYSLSESTAFGVGGSETLISTGSRTIRDKGPVDLLGYLRNIYNKDGDLKPEMVGDLRVLQAALLHKGIVYSAQGANVEKVASAAMGAGYEESLWDKVKGMVPWAGPPKQSWSGGLDTLLPALRVALQAKPANPEQAKVWQFNRDYAAGTGIFNVGSDGNLEVASNANAELGVWLTNLARQTSEMEQRTGVGVGRVGPPDLAPSSSSTTGSSVSNTQRESQTTTTSQRTKVLTPYGLPPRSLGAGETGVVIPPGAMEPGAAAPTMPQPDPDLLALQLKRRKQMLQSQAGRKMLELLERRIDKQAGAE